MGGPGDYFLMIGAIAVLIGFLLLWRMIIEVNAVMPGRVSLAVRKDWTEARRLHRKCFPSLPTSATRIASHVMVVLGVAAFLIAIILKAQSK
jgi:hypothetical protein